MVCASTFGKRKKSLINMRVLGIDPGTDRIGIGVVEYKKNSFRYIGSSLLVFKKNAETGKNLLSLELALRAEIKKYKPEKIGVESLFFSKNKKTALGVSEARGVILKTIAEAGIHCREITPAEAKLSVAGVGNADKALVARMVGKFLKKDLGKRLDDETDALAVAIATAFRARGL